MVATEIVTTRLPFGVWCLGVVAGGADNRGLVHGVHELKRGIPDFCGGGGLAHAPCPRDLKDVLGSVERRSATTQDEMVTRGDHAAG